MMSEQPNLVVGAGERVHGDLMDGLASFDKPSGCATPLCGGSGGLMFTEGIDGWVAVTKCGCGSQDGWEPLSEKDVRHLLSTGWDAIVALSNLLDALPHDLAVMWLSGNCADREDRIDRAIEDAEVVVKASQYGSRSGTDG